MWTEVYNQDLPENNNWVSYDNLSTAKQNIKCNPFKNFECELTKTEHKTMT